jgi:hypothetical protein
MSMKNKFNKVLSDFSNEEKVFLYNFLYEDLSGKGVCGDTELAHVNKHEMNVLRSMGGAGTINENTKCIQFFGSPPPPPPVQTTSVQTKEIPTELKPYVKEVLSEAQDIYGRRKEEGYVPYTGPEIAPFSPEQERAYAATSDVVGQTQALATPAAQAAMLASLGPTDADISRFMNPYATQVIDRTERERRRAADQEEQQLAAQSVAAGAFGGSRQGILEAERRRNLEQGIADMRATGLSEAYKQAMGQAQALQDARLGAAGRLTEIAQVVPRGTAEEIARLEAVGAARRGQTQVELDIGQRKFFEERTFPEATLTQYSQFIQPTQGALGAAGTLTRTMPGVAQPTYLQQASGFLGSLGKAYGAFKASDPKEKTDVKKIGMDDATGLAMYSFRYKDDPKTYPKVVGPMSNEVKEKYPELVSEVDGTEVVDFGGLASLANMNKEENVASLRQGGLVSLQGGGRTSFPDIVKYHEQQAENERREKEIINSNVDDPEDDPYPFTEEEENLLASASKDSPNSSVPEPEEKVQEEGLLSFLTKPTKIDPKQIEGPSRLDKISDLLIGYSQADPSKPLGTQLGQAAESMSAKQAKERQQMLTNILADRKLAAEEAALNFKTAKALDINTATKSRLISDLNKIIQGGGLKTNREKNIVKKNILGVIGNKRGSNVNAVLAALKRTGLLPTKPASTGGNEGTVLDKATPASKESLLRIDQPPPQPIKKPQQ